MEHKLFASMGFSICALIYLLFILYVYLSKKRGKTDQDKVFYFLLRLNILITITEFIYITLMSKVEMFPILCPLACRIYILETTTWLVTFFFYLWSLSQKGVKDKELVKKRNKKAFLSLTVLLVVANIISLCSPLDYIHPKNDFYVFGGGAVISVYILGLIIGLVVFAALILYRKSFPSRQRKPIIFTYSTIIILFAFQLITGYDFNFLAFIYTFVLSSLFFTIESQDYKLIEELEEKKKQAEIADKAKTNFLSSMSHSIRTPMTTILGVSDLLLKEDKLEEKQVEEGARDIYDSGAELLDLINNILDISRIESGKEEIEEKEYFLENLIFEIGSVVHAKINEESLEYQLSINQSLPSKYYGDYTKIFKTLTAIIINAINYTHYGNVLLSIDGEKEEDFMHFTFSVSNSGHEMSVEKFEQDFNDDINFDTEDSNYNINMYIAIAKRYVQMLGGKINFINEKGKGTQYIIKLDQKILDEKPIGNFIEKNNVHHTHHKRPVLNDKKFLIVDDNNVNLKIGKRLLERYEAKVVTATSGKECLDLVKEEHFDIIFLDHMMPEMDGMAVLKSLKSMGDIPPVIALTANSSTGLKGKYLQAGFSDYLSKPINNGELNRLMVKYFVKDEEGDRV